MSTNTTAGAEDSLPPALFHYGITPTTVPHSESAEKLSWVTWMITVSNPSGKMQPCSQIVFQFRCGEGRGDLIIDPGSIDASAARGTPWSIQHAGGGKFIAIPNAPETGLEAGDAIAFVLRRATVNMVAGASQIDVYEAGETTRQGLLNVIKEAPGLAITRFSGSPVQLAPGATAELEWTTTGAATATLSGQGQSHDVATDGRETVTLQDSAIYTLTVSGGGKTIEQFIPFTVVRAKILGFSAEPDVVAQRARVLLKWRARNTSTAIIKPGQVAVDPASGTLEVRPETTTTYVLEARGPGSLNNDSRSVVVTVEPVRILGFTATPDTIDLRGAARIEWNTAWASQVSIEPKQGVVGESGAISVSPQCDTTYTLTAQGLGGPIWQQVTVRVRATPLLPVGTILPFAGPIPQDLEVLGWMACNGRPLHAGEHPCLHKAIGKAYGSTSPDYFNIPDLRGVFLRGVTGPSANDPTAAARTASQPGGNTGNNIGSKQTYGTAPPKNSFRMTYGNLDITRETNDSGCQTRPASFRDATTEYATTSGGDAESRPKNKGVYFIIKTCLAIGGDSATGGGNLVEPPVGAVISYAGTTAMTDDRWQLCAGGKAPRDQYPQLVAAIGGVHGEAGPNDILLPDYRGYFLRGVDGGSRNDPNAKDREPPNPGGGEGRRGNAGDAVGSQQGWATGLPLTPLRTGFAHLPNQDAGKQVDGSMRRLARVNGGDTAVDFTGGQGGDSETRPANMSVDWYIRVR